MKSWNYVKVCHSRRLVSGPFTCRTLILNDPLSKKFQQEYVIGTIARPKNEAYVSKNRLEEQFASGSRFTIAAAEAN